MRNQGPHFLQAPHKPVPPSYQQLPAASPPHFRSVLPPQSLPPPPSIPPPPSHVYQHGPPGARSVIPQAPFMQVPTQGIANINQSYFHMQPPLHGSPLFPQGYLNAKHNSLAVPQSGVHIVHNAPHPRVSFTGNPPEFIHSAPFNTLPPHPTSQVESIYRAPLNVVPQHCHGGMQALQNLPLPPYPPRPPASFSFSAPTTSDIENSAFGDSVIPCVTPPPPSSPPPLPPSPPPSISLPSSFSVASASVSDVTCIPSVDLGSHSFPGNSMTTLESTDKVIYPNQVRYNGPMDNDLNKKGGSGCVPVGSMITDEFSSDRSEKLDRPSPPSKPTEKNNAKVETSCQSIAENVPVIDKMACQNESRNLSFGGEPGNGDATTDEFSSRAAQECNKLHCLIISGGNNTTADSDMEMEDDIIPVLKEQGRIESIQVINHESMDYGGKELIQGSHNRSTCSAAGVSYEKVSCSSSLSRGRQEAVEADDVDKCSQLIKSTSPFRLIQVYASDDDSENDKEPCNREVPAPVMPNVAASGTLSKLTMNNFTDMKRKNSNWDVEEIDRLPESLLSDKDSEVITKSWREANKTGEASNIKVDAEGAHQTIVCGNLACKSDKSRNDKEEKKAKLVTSPLKVDEFGRLVREGFSDSDSDDSSYMRRDYKSARSRNRSRSHSPADRKRKQRSPRRRRERRSRSSSRSWSPRIQRNRNRSPFRRRREFSSKARRERGQVPVCFNFINRGRCYRGASCHYMHHESSKNIQTRYNRGKQQHTDVYHTSIKNQNLPAEPEVIDIEHNEVKTASEPLSHDLPSNDCGIEWKEQEYTRGGVELNVVDKNNGLTDSDLCRHQSSGDRVGTIEEAQALRENPAEVPSLVPVEAVEPVPSLPSKGISHELTFDFDAKKLGGDTSQDEVPSVTNSVIFPSQSNYVAKLDKHYCSSPQRFSKSEPFPDKISPQQSGFCTSSSIEQVLSQQPSPHYPALKEFSHLTRPAIEFSYSSLQLPPPPPPFPLPQSASATNVPQLPIDYTRMPLATSLPFQFTSTENFGYPRVSSFTQHSQTSGLPSTSWIRQLPHQPLEDSTPNAGTSNYDTSFQLKNAFLPIPEPQRPFSNTGDFPGKPPGVDYPPTLSIGGLSLKREEHLMQNAEALDSSSFLPQRNFNPESRPLLDGSLADKMQYSFENNFHCGELWKSSSQIHPNSQFQPSRFNLQVGADGSQLGLSEAGSVSLPFPTSFPDFSGSRFPSHHNPYASTFEKPLPSNFSTGVWKQRDDTPISTDFCLNVQVGEQGLASVGSKQTTASPSSTTAIGQVLHKSGTDQYDPLLDCMEPSSSLRKSNIVKVREQTGDSDIIMPSSGSHKPSYFKENVEAGSEASSTSRNDEFGDRADAEVGAVENQSQGEANLTGGEIEIDQSKSEGKKKKNKSSRSTKLFKISIANFVKEVLKPSWRQGNMSEEAFKTIVKKSVEKVAGAMKSHHIPKSQAKINRYIESSQRKLMKLVMGYVNKYVRR